MKTNPNSINAKLTIISRNMIYLSILLFIIAGTLFFISGSLTWLFPILFISGATLGVIWGIVSGLLKFLDALTLLMHGVMVDIHTLFLTHHGICCRKNKKDPYILTP